jgi:hypothetical protein
VTRRVSELVRHCQVPSLGQDDSLAVVGNKACAIAVLSALVLLATLYLLAIGPYWKISPDSVSYVEGAVSLASGQGYLKDGEPVLVFPPGTSLLFTIPLLLFPNSYLALNALVTGFALLAHAACYVLFRKRMDSTWAALTVLLSLGSTLVFYQSTRLLSDIIYLFLSPVALIASEQTKSRHTGRASGLPLACLVLASCMTRLVGVTLIGAIALHALFTRRREEAWRITLVLMLLVALPVALWEARNLRLGISSLKLALQNQQWVDEAGYVSPSGLLYRMYRNLDDFGALGGILINGTLSRFGAERSYFELSARVASLAFLCLGLGLSIARRLAPTDVYCAVYLLTIAAYEPGIDVRKLVPLVPLLFYYALVGTRFIAQQASRSVGSTAAAMVYVALLAYTACFLRIGVGGMVREIPLEHTSPFGTYPIKYPQNYDVQRLALWLRENSDPSDKYLAQHVDMMAYFTEREGHYLPFSADPHILLNLLDTKDIKYVLADKKKPMVRQYMLPVVRAHPELFSLILEEEQAALYEFHAAESAGSD